MAKTIYDGLYRYKLTKLYAVAKKSKDNRKNMGYDYKDKIMKKSVSPHIYRNEIMIDFLDFINDFIYEKIKAVKRLKLFKSFTVDKDYDIE